jgi:hypothetical protein
MGEERLCNGTRSGEGEPVVLSVGEWYDRETELTEEDGVLEDGGGAHVVERFGLLEALAGLDADDGVFGVRGVDGDYGGCADGFLTYVGVVDDELLALLHGTEIEEGSVVGDAVPGGLTIANKVVEGVLVWF